MIMKLSDETVEIPVIRGVKQEVVISPKLLMAGCDQMFQSLN